MNGNPSTQEEITAATTRTIEAGGLTFLIRRVPIVHIDAVFIEAGSESDSTARSTRVQAGLDWMRLVARHGLLTPLSFDGGSPGWDDLSLAQQKSIVMAIRDFTFEGLLEVNSNLAPFPSGGEAGDEGGGNGAGPGGALSNAGAPAA